MNVSSQITQQRIVNWKLSRFNPIRNLIPESLSRMMDSFAQGNLREFALMMDAIENRDDVIKNVALKRKSSVARRTFDVLLVPDMPPELAEQAQRHQEALSYFYNNLTATNAVDGNERGGFSLLVRQMMDAVGKRYAVHELIWEPGEDGMLTAKFKFVPLWFFENRMGRLRFLRNDFDLDGAELDDGAWMVTTGPGIMEACAVAYMFKRLPLQDWLSFSERSGSPGLEGVTDAQKDSDEWNDLKEAVDLIGNNFSVVHSRTSEIKALDLGSLATLPYPLLIERMDRALAALWRGADLSTISAGSGSGQGASLQDRESALLESDDANMVQETLWNYVDAKVIEYIFGPGVKPLAYVSIIVPPKVDIEGNIKVDQFLLDNGAPLGVQATLDRYGRAMPDPDDAILIPRPQPVGAALYPGQPDGRNMANETQRGAGSSTDGPSEELILNALSEAMGVRKQWLAPLRVFMAELIAGLNDPEKSDEALLAFAEKAANTLPELIDELDVAALAQSLESAMGSAVVAGVRDGIRAQKAESTKQKAEKAGNHE